MKLTNNLGQISLLNEFLRYLLRELRPEYMITPKKAQPSADKGISSSSRADV